MEREIGNSVKVREPVTEREKAESMNDRMSSPADVIYNHLQLFPELNSLLEETWHSQNLIEVSTVRSTR